MGRIARKDTSPGWLRQWAGKMFFFVNGNQAVGRVHIADVGRASA
jgi:hypothetical protein